MCLRRTFGVLWYIFGQTSTVRHCRPSNSSAETYLRPATLFASDAHSSVSAVCGCFLRSSFTFPRTVVSLAGLMMVFMAHKMHHSRERRHRRQHNETIHSEPKTPTKPSRKPKHNKPKKTFNPKRIQRGKQINTY